MRDLGENERAKRAFAGPRGSEWLWRRAQPSVTGVPIGHRAGRAGDAGPQSPNRRPEECRAQAMGFRLRRVRTGCAVSSPLLRSLSHRRPIGSLGRRSSQRRRDRREPSRRPGLPIRRWSKPGNSRSRSPACWLRCACRLATRTADRSAVALLVALTAYEKSHEAGVRPIGADRLRVLRRRAMGR